MRLAAEKGSDGRLIARPLNAPPPAKYTNGTSAEEPQLAASR